MSTLVSKWRARLCQFVNSSSAFRPKFYLPGEKQKARELRRIKISRSGFVFLGNPNSFSPKKKREHNYAWRQRQHDTKKDRLNCRHRSPRAFDSANQHAQRASWVFLVSIETRRLRATTDWRGRPQSHSTTFRAEVIDSTGAGEWANKCRIWASIAAAITSGGAPMLQHSMLQQSSSNACRSYRGVWWIWPGHVSQRCCIL